mgnify:CR=1 FL=1
MALRHSEKGCGMRLTFTTKRKLQRIGLVSLIVLMVAILVWFCWVLWLERFMVYSEDGATLNFDVAHSGVGEVAVAPHLEETVSIYINEGSNAVNTSTELTGITGYYIDADALTQDYSTVKANINTLPAGTAVMMEMKNIWGSFFYSSNLADATLSTKLDTKLVDALIQDLNSKNLYTIAVIPAFRERYYCLLDSSYASAGLAQKGKAYLWADDESCYWLNPASTRALNWVISIIQELKSLGFDEVVLTEFRFPNTGDITFNGDQAEALASAASTLMTTCSNETFAVSFMTDDSAFVLPEGRSRLYLENISAKTVDAVAATVQVPNTLANLVFVATTNDTRYDAYSSLKPITLMNDPQR